ncbi:DUF6375 family protein [Delftia tsuruhatensis]|jgi:hypothetical protein|uniref:DUF6375 family protein n=1 Tax=Delftia tsuruhatensis TaxID=180282 RepID=UPI002444EF2F|nr:DUF6375 family protein [Delftia tsuruhatensis]MDH0777775.1 DUF6375 family protein [Delftia tsuruhatensis]MDH1462202.1 DUF6375 family protein [Delftia tsuruhatensis]MDH1827451.1 DUF6375 family protein [Delftia tsuruhatensis]WGG09315.1 DUF6375 family protein [Delftia tsuruhatensis]
MKIWSGYGSEHSMNLVLIGKFKKAQDAEKVEKDIEKLSEQALKDETHSFVFDPDPKDLRFSEGMLSLLRGLRLNTLGPDEIGQLVSDYRLEREDDRIIVKTDEADVSAFVKLFIEAGAKVEVFSAHDYPADSANAS